MKRKRAPKRSRVRRLIVQANAVRISVEYGYEMHSIMLPMKKWRRVVSGRALRVRGDRCFNEDGTFWDAWNFAGGLDGRVVVTYEKLRGSAFDTGEGFAGKRMRTSSFFDSVPLAPL